MAAFHTSVARHYAPHGLDSFAAYADPASLVRRQRAGHRSWVALVEGTVVGLVEVRVPAQVSMLFVTPERQRRGVGTALLERGLQDLNGREPRPAAITVQAAPNAVAFFAGRGFVEAGAAREKDGVRFVPMRS
jgi:GNAT superfamily N-acetyltransferase